MWHLGTEKTEVVAQHKGGVKDVLSINDGSQIVTGSWDKTIKYWDLRSPNPTYTHKLSAGCCAMDVNSDLLVLATAGNDLQVCKIRR